MELQREALIDVAMGYEPADTVITNGRVVNVHTGTVKAEGMERGFIALRNGTVEASLPTPLNGLASDLPFDDLFERQYKLIDAWRDMGCELETPQMNLEFVSLVTIPYYRISTKGLAYMTEDRFELAELFVD